MKEKVKYTLEYVGWHGTTEVLSQHRVRGKKEIPIFAAKFKSTVDSSTTENNFTLFLVITSAASPLKKNFYFPLDLLPVPLSFEYFNLLFLTWHMSLFFARPPQSASTFGSPPSI